MTDTGIRYTHCRGPHCGGAKLHDEVNETQDGLCLQCYMHARAWAQYPDYALESPEWSVAIDQWLESGAP